MKNLIRNSLKLTGAGAVIAAVWFVALTQEPADEPGVADAHADIGAMSLGDDGQEFTRAMTSLGLTPRRYDFNGNMMYFAAGTTDLMPEQVENLVSQEMVERGINSRPTTDLPATGNAMLAWSRPDGSGEPTDELQDMMNRNAEKVRPQTEATMQGDLVTTLRTKQLVRMEGIKWNLSKDEIVARAKDGSIPAREKKFANLMGGYRFVEATYDSDDGMTDVSAVWSADDNFVANRMTNDVFLQQEADPNVPACMGCDRMVRMQSMEKDEPLRSNEWHTNTGVNQAYEFYLTSMTNRGWKESGAQRVLDEAAKIVPQLNDLQSGGKIVHLEKGGKSMQIVLIPDPNGGTDVFSQERFKASQSAFEKDELAK